MLPCDIEMRGPEWDTVVKEFPDLCDFVCKYTEYLRKDNETKLMTYTHDFDVEFIKLMCYKMNVRRDSDWLSLLTTDTKVMRKVRGYLRDEYDMARLSCEQFLMNSWLASGDEKTAFSRVLELRSKERWGKAAVPNVTNTGPTQILFSTDNKKPQKPSAAQVGWQGVEAANI